MDFLGQAPHVSEIQIAEFVSEETLAKFKDAILANKPKKGKKGKKKKKWTNNGKVILTHINTYYKWQTNTIWY